MEKVFFKISMFFLILLYGCGHNIEEAEEVNCDPEPVVHEIIWMVGTSTQNATIIIKPGDTVRWIWGEEGMPHDVSSDDPNAPDDFGSEILTGKGQVYEYTFMEETTFDYRCSIHPSTMFGAISVVVCEENSTP